MSEEKKGSESIQDKSNDNTKIEKPVVTIKDLELQAPLKHTQSRLEALKFQAILHESAIENK